MWDFVCVKLVIEVQAKLSFCGHLFAHFSQESEISCWLTKQVKRALGHAIQRSTEMIVKLDHEGKNIRWQTSMVMWGPVDCEFKCFYLFILIYDPRWFYSSVYHEKTTCSSTFTTCNYGAICGS